MTNVEQAVIISEDIVILEEILTYEDCLKSLRFMNNRTEDRWTSIIRRIHLGRLTNLIYRIIST